MRELSLSVDGEHLSGKLYEPEGAARGQVVLVHGLLSQAKEFAALPERLAAAGFRTLALDQRGFGASGGARGIITRERATADVLAGVAALRKEGPNLPVALVGHSMGAVFTVRALARDPTIKAAVLAAPMDTIRGELITPEYWMYRALETASKLTSMTPLGPVRVPYKYDYDRLFQDKEAVRRAREDPFLHPTVDMTNVPEFLAMNVSQEARAVKQPVLVLLAEHDRAVRRANSMRVYDRLGGEKELVIVDSGHSVWADRDAEAAIAHVVRWLRAKL